MIEIFPICVSNTFRWGGGADNDTSASVMALDQSKVCAHFEYIQFNWLLWIDRQLDIEFASSFCHIRELKNNSSFSVEVELNSVSTRCRYNENFTLSRQQSFPMVQQTEKV